MHHDQLLRNYEANAFGMVCFILRNFVCFIIFLHSWGGPLARLLKELGTFANLEFLAFFFATVTNGQI